MDSRPGDETLLLAVAEGDMGAFGTLYERHAGWLAIRLVRRCNDRDLVADAIQDTFVAVWQRPRGFRGDGDIGAWLWGIAIRRLVSRLRTRSSVAAVLEKAGAAPAAGRRTGHDGRRRRRAGADGAQPRAAGRALGPHVPGTRRRRAVLGSRVVDRPRDVRGGHRHLDRRSEPVPGGCPVFCDRGDDGLEASRTPPCGQPHPPRRLTPFCLGRPVRSVDGTYPD